MTDTVRAAEQRREQLRRAAEDGERLYRVLMHAPNGPTVGDDHRIHGILARELGDALALVDALLAALAASEQALQDAEREANCGGVNCGKCRECVTVNAHFAIHAAESQRDRAERAEAALAAARRALAFIAQEAKDGALEVRQGVENAPTFWLQAIEKRARAALASLPGEPPPPSEPREEWRLVERYVPRYPDEWALVFKRGDEVREVLVPEEVWRSFDESAARASGGGGEGNR